MLRDKHVEVPMKGHDNLPLKLFSFHSDGSARVCAGAEHAM
jgi:hypothetical protein